MAKKEYSVELTKLIKIIKTSNPTQLEIRKVKELNQEEKEIYMKAGGLCFTCHQPTGQGLALGHFPPLAGSEWVLGEKEPLIKIAMHGLNGPIKVKGKDYGLVPMPPPGVPPGSLTDQQIADVLTYIRNDWGNSASAVSPEEVAAVREKIKGRATMQMWTAAELKGGSE